jgi:hypothetical protein
VKPGVEPPPPPWRFRFGSKARSTWIPALLALALGATSRADVAAPDAAGPAEKPGLISSSGESWRDEDDRSPETDEREGQGRLELTGYEGLAGGLIFAGGASQLWGWSVPVLVLTGVGVGAASALVTFVLTPSDLPAFRAQLAATGALWGGIVPWLVLSIRNGETTNSSWNALLIGSVAGDAAGLVAGFFLSPPSGVVSLVNSGAGWGLILGAMVAAAAQLPSTAPAPIGLVAGGAGAMATAVTGVLLRPTRKLILAYDLAVAAGLGVGALIAELAWLVGSPHGPLQPEWNQGSVLSVGALIGAGLGVGTAATLHIFTDSFDSLSPSRPVALAPWALPGGTGVLAAIRF